jgi:hypothetical protein
MNSDEEVEARIRAELKEIVDMRPTGNDFVSVDIDDVHACALRSNGGLFCWGKKTHEAGYQAPSTNVSSFAVSQNWGCAVQDGRAVCWGSHIPGPLDGEYDRVFAGFSTACARRQSDGHPHCIGNRRISNPPDVPITTMSVGDHACAIASDGRLHCWGDNDFGQATPPEQLTAGGG